MARQHSPSKIAAVIHALRSEWHRLTARVGDIEALFTELGISHKPETPRGRRPGRPKSTSPSKLKPGRRQKRKRFGQSADEFVLGLLKDKKLTAAEINAAWRKAGRGGVSNNSLTKLSKAKRFSGTRSKGKEVEVTVWSENK